jgi:branched-chain amino acid transport system ATP-binding protein
MHETGKPLLSVRDLEVIYDHVIVGVRDVSLDVCSGEIVALLGANGAGKSTTLKAISGLVRAERGEIVAGTVHYDRRDGREATAAELVRDGLVLVLEGRHCFPQLTVEENLLAGALSRKMARSDLRERLERMYVYFPRLRLLRRKQAGYASGGEQQMVAIARALMSGPRLVLLDEPSMGLAPQIVAEIFQIVRHLNEAEGVSFLLAEQNATQALALADRGVILEGGKVVASDSSEALRGRDDVKASYLGVDQGRRASFRNARYDRPKGFGGRSMPAAVEL